MASAVVRTGCRTTRTGIGPASSRSLQISADWSATWSQGLVAVQRLAAGEEPDLEVLVSHAISPGGSALAVDVLVAVVQAVDVRLRDRYGLAELAGEVHGAARRPRTSPRP